MEQDKVSRRDFLRSCILGSATLLLSSCAGGTMNTRVPTTGSGSLIKPSASRTITHTVRNSETVWSLSKQYNVPVEVICRANGLKPGSPIHAGQKLIIPGSLKSLSSLAPSPSGFPPPPNLSPVTAPQTFVTPISMPVDETMVHEVAPLETVWRISKMYNVSPNSIYEANRLRPGTPIHVGQKLVIPNAKAFHNVIPLYPNTKWEYIIVHHTATDIGNAFLINRSHHDRGFWHGLGYHFLIDNGTLGKGDGQIEASPRWIRQQDGAHCKAGGMNTKGIGIGLVGNFNEALPTPNQIKSLVYLTKTLEQGYSIRSSRILQHRQVPGARTDCPGNQFPWSNFQAYVCNT